MPFGLVLSLAAVATEPVARLRVITFNVHAFRDADHRCSFDRIASLLTKLQPDILCLNEVIHPFTAPPADDPYWSTVRHRRGRGYTLPPEARPHGEHEAFLARLSQALGLPHVAFGPATTTGSSFGLVPFGNSILSRHALTDVTYVAYKVSEQDMRLGEQTRTPADMEDRACILATVDLPCGIALGVACMHLDHKAEELREEQCSQFIAAARRHFREQPYVLCGDLNSFDSRDMDADGWQRICALYASKGWPPPRRTSLVRTVLDAAGLDDTFALWTERTAQEKPPSTSWTATRIDYVMLSRQQLGAEASLRIRIRSHRTVASDASDHLPVVVDFEVLH